MEEYSPNRVLQHLKDGGNVAIKVGETRQRVWLCVIDIDNKSSRLRRFARDNGYSSKQEVITASGMRHIWGRLADDAHAISSKIKPGNRCLDLKTSGLMMWPPSRINGQPYRLPRGRTVLAPDELPVFDLTPILEEPYTETKSPILEVGKRARGLVTRIIRNPLSYVLCIESHQGSNGSAGLVRAVCCLRDHTNWSAKEIYDFLMREWNYPPRVTPKWSDADLARTVNRHVQN